MDMVDLIAIFALGDFFFGCLLVVFPRCLTYRSSSPYKTDENNVPLAIEESNIIRVGKDQDLVKRHLIEKIKEIEPKTT